MLPVAAETRPPQLRLRIARILLWAALVLLVAVQFLDCPGGNVGKTWSILGDMIMDAGYAGWGGFTWPPEWLCSYVTAHLSIAAAPWLARVLGGHTPLLWLARIFSVAAFGSLAWCVSSTDPVWAIYHYQIPIWAGCLVLPSFLNAGGLFLLPARKIPPLNYDASSSR